MNRIDPKALAPPLTEARLARQYEAIRSRVGAARPRRAWAAWSAAFAAAAALVAVLVMARRTPPAGSGLIEGAVLEAGGSGEGAHLVLGDGSRLDLAAHTRARLTSARPNAIRIDLEGGRVEVEATHLEGRTFVVAAGHYEVRVVGTHFVVERAAGDRVTVRVDRGTVEVAGVLGEVRRLTAGEQWSAPDGAEPPTAAPEPSAAPSAPAAVTPSSTAAVDPPASAPPTPPEESARGLFDQAQQARAQGRPQEAARAFDRLRRTFRHDRRASLAAFELGRMRLDALDDPRGAEEALRDAIALGPGSPFREDAEARRVEALARLHDDRGCAAARDAYLARWPNGTYRRAVEIYCGAR
jgi:hypothetical protein